METKQMGFATRAIHAGEGRDPSTKALNTPIYQTSTFAFERSEELVDAITDSMNWVPGVCLYSRSTNPTTMALEKKIASLEHAEDASITASGMAAVSTALMSLLGQGDHCIASNDLFVITKTLLDEVFDSKGIEVTRVDTNNLQNIENSIKENTKVIFLEALSNPRLDFADIPSIAEIAKKHQLKLVVDNTFLSPYLLRPLELGADLVVHSATKYMAGHGDTLGGVVAGDKVLVDKAKYYNDNLGTSISPFNSWLLLRGLRTLHLRMQAHSKNAMAIAEFLEKRPEIGYVTYPGLKSHPHRTLIEKYLTNGYGGMVSFHLKGGKAAMDNFVNCVTLPPIAVSLGDVQTLIYPKPKDGNLIRLSVGCEDVEDIIKDFEEAFEKMAKL